MTEASKGKEAALADSDLNVESTKSITVDSVLIANVTDQQ
jgi:hypothetical protein